MTEEVQAADDQFTTIVYKGHGPHSRAGGTYDYAAANDQEDLDAKLADGWFATLPEAIDAHDKPAAVAKSDDTAPPTRKELEAKAKELGIKFTTKTTDAELSTSIAAALAKE